MMNVAAAITHDRQVRRSKMSRREYGEITGFTPTKIGNMESGRKLKSGELERLLPFIGDLLGDNPDISMLSKGGPPSGGAQSSGVQAAVAVEQRPSPIVEDEMSYDDRKQQMLERYNRLQQRLDGKPTPAIGLPSSYRIDQSPPEEWPRWHAWMDKVEATLPAAGHTASDDNNPWDGEDYYWSHKPDPDVETPEKEDPEIESPKTTPTETPRPAPMETPESLPPGRYITNGELRSFKRCRRKWYLSSYRKVGLPTSPIIGAAPLGTVVHEALAGWYQPAGMQKGDPMKILERRFEIDAKRLAEAQADDHDLKAFHGQCEFAKAIIEGYLEWIAETSADVGLEIVAPETRVYTPLPGVEGVNLLAKLDVRARRKTGDDDARLFMDHKTVGDLKRPAMTVQMDEQMLHYHLIEFLSLLAEHGSEGADQQRTDGAIYNMLRKSKRTAAAKPPFYDRVEVRHNKDTLRSYLLRVIETVKTIQEVERRLDNGEDHRAVAYPTPTGDCTWDCDHFAICTMFDDGSRVEDFINAYYVEINPLKRYEPDQVGVTG